MRAENRAQTGLWQLAAARCAWAAMLLIHVAPLISSWKSFFANGQDIGQIGACLGLTAAAVFFLLKLYGVQFLRFHTDRASCAALGLAVLLVHADVLGAPANGVIGPKYDPIIATTLLIGCVLPARRILRTLTAGLCANARRLPQLQRSIERMLLDGFLTVRWVFTHRIRIPRAPPA
ncbi:MAG: hypothetical protein O7B26_09500 [Planctomycetota bacterium]|nr:hypothetical protein [Planctomycetota bacterium]